MWFIIFFKSDSIYSILTVSTAKIVNNTTHVLGTFDSYTGYSRLALAVRIFAKYEFISENAKTNLRSFAKVAKKYLVESTRYNFEICEKKKRKCERKNVCFCNFCERNFRPSASLGILDCVFKSLKYKIH